jgi:hypothetical protein
MKKLLLSTALVMLAAPAYAGLVTWDFGEHSGPLTATQTFDTTGGGLFSLTAKGFTAGDAATNLFSKLGGTDENGLGLTNDPSGNDEISLNHGFVQLNLDGLLSKLHGFEFSFASTSQGEGWGVWGSQDGSPFSMTFLTQSIGLNDEATHFLPGGWDNYNFFYLGGLPNLPPSEGGCQLGCNANVLLASFAATQDVGGVPEPSTWAMGLMGFGLVGFTGLYRTRREARYAL